MAISKLSQKGKIFVVVLVIIAAVLAGACVSRQASPRNFGQGQQAGPQGGQGAGPGGGAGTGPGVVTPVLLPRTNASPLADAEAGDILFMRGEEQLAHDLYTRWATMYGIPIFSNIAASETQHITEVQLLIERYGLTDQPAGNASVGFYNRDIQSLYDSLEKQGDTSLNDALEAGLAIEEHDIADLDRVMANTTRADILQVYSNLRQGSENHKSAFLRQLGR